MVNRHPWHDIDQGQNALGIIKAMVEIAKGSRCKYELHKPTSLPMLDRTLYSAVHYGLTLQTYYLNHDPLDIIVICSEELIPLSILDARVIGVMQIENQAEPDDKIIALATNYISLDHIKDIRDVAAYKK